MSKSWKERMVVYPIILLVFVLIARVASRSLVFPGCTVPVPADAPGVDYATDDGIKLRGAWIKAKNPNGLAVLFFHGNAESAGSDLPFGLELAAAGYDVFLAEYRGYGGCPGSPSEEGLRRDALAALAQVRALGVKDEQLILCGLSLGSGLAVELARQNAGRALVLVAPYTSIWDVASGTVGPLAPLLVRDRFDSLSRIADVKMPVTVIHGTNDTLIPYAHGKKLSEVAPHGKLVPVDGRGHNDLPVARLVLHELSAIRAGLTTK